MRVVTFNFPTGPNTVSWTLDEDLVLVGYQATQAGVLLLDPNGTNFSFTNPSALAASTEFGLLILGSYPSHSSQLLSVEFLKGQKIYVSIGGSGSPQLIQLLFEPIPQLTSPS